MCQELVFWALIVRKILQLQRDVVSLTLLPGNYILPYILVYADVSVGCCCFIEGLGWEGGGGCEKFSKFCHGELTSLVCVSKFVSFVFSFLFMIRNRQYFVSTKSSHTLFTKERDGLQ